MAKDNIFKKFLKISAPLFIYFAAQFLAVLVFALGYSFIVGDKNFSKSLDITSSGIMPALLISSIITIIIMYFYIRKNHKDEFSLEPLKEVGFKKTLLLIFFMFGLYALTVSIISIFNLNEVFKGYDESLSFIDSSGILMTIFVAGILGPIAEELVFRGGIYKSLTEYVSVKQAMVFQALVFGVIHGNLLQVIYTFLLALFFAYIYDKYKSIYIPIICHMAYNLSNQLFSFSIFNFLTNNSYILLVFAVILLITTGLILKKQELN